MTEASAHTVQVADARVADAKDAYLAEFEAFANDGASPEWVRALRRDAITRFAERGFPSPRDEAWRFTNIAPLLDTAFTATAGVHRLESRAIAPLRFGDGSWPQAVVVNGRYAPELSSSSGLPAGVRIGGLAEALEGAADLVQSHFGRYARYQDNVFTALSTALFRDGVFVYVPAGVAVEQPVEVLFVAAPGGRPIAIYPRCLVVADRGATVTVVESYAATAPGVYLTNAVTEVVAGDGARVGFYRLQREGRQAYHVATTQTHQGRDSAITACAVTLGARLARHDLNSVLDGPNAECTLNGLYVLGDRQHADHHMLVEHAQPHGTSHELFNGILDDHARAVFTGKIFVRKGAQRTDAKQVNNNMLLSDTARADSQPQLEIYADDVKCTHGSTLGPLDPGALFYLRSRGLDRPTAQSLLTYGFAADIVTRVPDAAIRERLDRLVRQVLGRAAAAMPV